MVNKQSSEQPNTGRYWLATDAETAQVASHLGISLAAGDAEEIEANYSRVFVVNGDVAHRRVVKIRARWMTEARIKFEHALTLHLRDHGLPVVAPLTIEGDSTWAQVGAFFCEIAPYVDGREASASLADVHLMGEILGRFHRSCHDFDLSLYTPPYFQNQAEPRDLDREVERLRRQVEEMDSGDSDRAQAFCVRREELNTLYQTQCASLPRVIRHGDLHPWNLLFSRSEPARIAALFDLDMSATGPRIFDISYAIYMLRRLHPESHLDGWDTRYRRFVDAYAGSSGEPLTEDEVAVVALQIECIILGFLLRTAAYAGFQKAAGECEEYAEIVNWLETPELTKVIGLI